jgi:hypothetical protein
LEREGAGLDARQIHRDELETSAADSCQHLGTERINNRPNKISGRQLDPRDLIVMPNSQVGESQLSQGRLGAFDLAQLGWRHGMVVRNSRSEAGRRRLVGHWQSQRSRHRTHRKLGHAHLSEGPEDVVISRSAGTWSVRPSGVVGILSVRDRIQPVTLDHLIINAAEQFVFAVEAPVRAVSSILRMIIFMGYHFDDHYAYLACDVMRRLTFLGRQTRRDPEQRNNPLLAKSPRGERKQQGRVDATRESNAQPLHPAEFVRHGRDRSFHGPVLIAAERDRLRDRHGRFPFQFLESPRQ